MSLVYQKRRTTIAILSLTIFAYTIIINLPNKAETITSTKSETNQIATSPAKEVLDKLNVQNYASSKDYSRYKFGSGWDTTNGCDTRNIILNRDLKNVKLDDECNVISGILNDPYTGSIIDFTRGSETSGAIQIDHIVALSDAWKTGAQQFTPQQRIKLANDPLELLAVDGSANQQKSDGNASVWLPQNKSFQCQYVARQIAVKQEYNLWVTQPEYDTMSSILDKCPNQLLPSP